MVIISRLIQSHPIGKAASPAGLHIDTYTGLVGIAKCLL